MSKICILGAGAMGSAFSFPCTDSGHETTIIGTQLEDNFIDLDLVSQNQISGVPVFIFNDQWTISGAQSSKVIENTIDLAGNDN